MQLELILSSEQQTLQLGTRLAQLCTPPCLVFLQGDLGAGKTTLVRGFLRGLGFAGQVKSPTYTLVEPYEIQHKQLFHFDLYRLQDPAELLHIGIADYFATPCIALIEWPERALEQLPIPDLTCYIRAAVASRHLLLIATSEKGEHILQRLDQDKECSSDSIG
jgi:tRNA threonylcarbamoyladenosine biosynthesis protein TsaE